MQRHKFYTMITMYIYVPISSEPFTSIYFQSQVVALYFLYKLEPYHMIDINLQCDSASHLTLLNTTPACFTRLILVVFGYYFHFAVPLHQPELLMAPSNNQPIISSVMQAMVCTYTCKRLESVYRMSIAAELCIPK